MFKKLFYETYPIKISLHVIQCYSKRILVFLSHMKDLVTAIVKIRHSQFFQWKTNRARLLFLKGTPKQVLFVKAKRGT